MYYADDLNKFSMKKTSYITTQRVFFLTILIANKKGGTQNE